MDPAYVKVAVGGDLLYDHQCSPNCSKPCAVILMEWKKRKEEKEKLRKEKNKPS
jgi:hypothetical protein